MARLSHDMTEDEVRDEYEWMVMFIAAMAESIRGTKDVHSLAAYVRKLERENAELRELLRETLMDVGDYAEKYGIEHSYDAVDAHLDERLRALGIETS